MGMRHSSTVSSANFLQLVEMPLFTKDLGIQLYARYHDDIMIIGEHVTQCKLVCHEIKSLARKCYTVTVDECSMQGVNILDLSVDKRFKSDGACRLEWRPFVKPTARHVPYPVGPSILLLCTVRGL